ncbi:hypothetical protein ZIOFF_007423 [Zingiber officinale]|uniref:Uncharacterized protein n=1 Tax=Zingiber officinale TaxID=94328 RepID=A0A8J5M5S5_ZINOF|nr:hypothetical protein ZIOFF_007423 [Zingiber officinale]
MSSLILVIIPNRPFLFSRASPDPFFLPQPFLSPERAPTISSSSRPFLSPVARDSSSLIPAPSLLRRDSLDAAQNAPTLPSFRRCESSLLPAPIIAVDLFFDLIQNYIVDMKHLGSSGFAEGGHSIEDNVNFAEGDMKLETFSMQPKRIEHLPVLETPVDDCSSSGRPLCRETRDTHSDRLRRQISARGRLPVTFRQSDGHPIGPNAASFMTELGLSAAFDISFQEGSSSVMKETDRLMSARYRDNRSKMHNHYKKLSHLPPAERRQHIPIEFCETQDDWDYMCTLFESEAFQITHSITNDDMVRLRDECILSQNSEDVIDVFQIADTVYDQVLGTRSGYIRGLGSGPKPVRSTSSDATSSSRSTNAALRERLESTQDELASTKIQLANTQDELASIKSRQDKFEQILNRLAPGALDSLIHASSSTPPPPPPPPS